MTYDLHDYSNPFPGLRPFESDESHLFFGRDGQSDELLRRLRRSSFLAVVGTSGSGKSSLVRAGLLSSLYGGFMTQAGAKWRVALFRPGNDPLGKLARVLNDTAVLGGHAADEEELRREATITEATLRRGALGLVTAVRQARLPKGENLLIVVDQFEEIFRFKRAGKKENAEDEAAAFVKLLLEAARQNELPIYVIITMRSDFLGDCAQFRDLPEAINDGQYLIPRMTRDQRREAITGPIAVGGAAISPRLVNRLLNDVGDNPDQLPIMQHALMRTWDFWKAGQTGEGDSSGAPLDLAHYDAIGTMTDALSRHADEAYLELSEEDGSRRIAERVFKSLTEKGPDNREIRRPTSLSEIAEVAGVSEEEVTRVVETFRQVGRSFLMPPPGVTLRPESLIDISHESLIRGWERLRNWTDEEAESAKIYRRLSETVDLRREGKAGLWRDPDLAVALDWREKNHPNQSWANRYDPDFDDAVQFLADSQTARDAELAARELAQRREVRRTRVFSAIITAAFLMSLTLGVFAYQSRNNALSHAQAANVAREEAEKQKLIAQQHAREADAARVKATASEKKAVEEQGRAEEQAQLAEEQAQLAGEKRRQAEAAQQAERAALATARSAESAAVQSAARAEDSEKKWRDEALSFREQKFDDSSLLSTLADRLIQVTPREEVVHWRNIKANALTNMGDHSAAAQELTESLNTQPDNFRARQLRGYMYMLTGRPEESVVDLRKTLKEKPESSLEHLNLGISLGMMGEYHEAREHIEQSIKKSVRGEYDTLLDNEVSPDIQMVTGRALLSATGEEFFNALHYQLANIEAFRGGDIGAAMEKARASSRGGNTNTYLTALNWAWLQSLHREQDYGALAAQAALWEQAGYKELAVRNYDEFMKKHSGVLREAGQGADATRYRTLAQWVETRLRALDPKGQLRRGSEAGEAVDMRGARALAIEAKEREARKDFAGAQRLLDRALAKEPANIKILLQRALLLYAAGEKTRGDVQKKYYQGAKEDAVAVLKLSPRNPQAIILRASVNNRLEQAGVDDPEATKENIVADLRRALEYDPLNGEALTFLAVNVGGQPREALDLFKRSLRIYPSSTWIYREMAALHNSLGEREEARKAIETAVMLAASGGDYATMTGYFTMMDKIESADRDGGSLRGKAQRAIQLGDLALGQGKVQAAYSHYVAGDESLKRAAEIASGKSDPTLACEQALARDKIARVVAAGRELKYKESFAGKVAEVAPGEGKDREITLGKGSRDDMAAPGTQVSVHALPGAGGRLTRDVIRIGKGEILKVSPDRTTVRVTLDDPKGNGLVQVGDLVQYEVELPVLPPRSALLKLAGLEINFTDQDGKPLFDYRGLSVGATPEMIEGILARMVKEVHDGARNNSLREELGKKIESGRFQGLTIGEAMAKAGRDDVENLLDFAAGNTSPLIGRDWSFAFIYRIWLSINAPLTN
jgi:Tfp pilus assembly protein PilF/energy-coupling factor transporter ATP-binding protein EcfA2